jgi:hypothetical protein
VTPIAKLSGFKPDSFAILCKTVGKSSLAKAVFDLVMPMLDYQQKNAVSAHLLETTEKTKDTYEVEVGYLGGKTVTLLAKFAPVSLARRNLQKSVIKAGNFRRSFW